MQRPASSFDFGAGSYAERYQALLVPRLFAPWARRLLDSVEFRSGERLLDVACGPGTVTREAAQRGGKGVTGVDSSAAMLDIARILDERATIVYLQATADALPVPDGAFDVVTCQQGLQFFDDRAKSLAEMRRALTSRGRAGIAVWAGPSEQPFWTAIVRGLQRSAAGGTADALHKPFSFGDAADLRDEMISAGFANVAVFSADLPIVFEGGLTQAAQSAYATPAGNDLEQLDSESRTRILDATMDELSRFEHAGVVQSTCRAHIGVARR